MQPWKRRHNCLKLCRVAFQDFEFLASSLQDSRGDVGKHSLRENHHVIERCKGHLGLNHPKLSQMAPGFRFFSAKCWAETVGLTKGRGSGFVVKLPRLREICFLAFKIVYFE